MPLIAATSALASPDAPFGRGMWTPLSKGTSAAGSVYHSLTRVRAKNSTLVHTGARTRLETAHQRSRFECQPRMPTCLRSGRSTIEYLPHMELQLWNPLRAICIANHDKGKPPKRMGCQPCVAYSTWNACCSDLSAALPILVTIEGANPTPH
jgi:hypothetical protein